MREIELPSTIIANPEEVPADHSLVKVSIPTIVNHEVPVDHSLVKVSIPAIANHEVPADHSLVKVSMPEQTFSTIFTVSAPSQQTVQYIQMNGEEGCGSNITVYKTDPSDSWPSLITTQESTQKTVLEENVLDSPRIRKKKRPYSPPPTSGSRKTKQSRRKSKSIDDKDEDVSKPFSCDRCKSPYVVNPTRALSSAKTYRPRRVIDPDTKKPLVVCNACRLWFAKGRKRKEKSSKKTPPSEAEKTEFLKECEKFSASLVEFLQDTDAARLYCPSFVFQPCLCLQRYLNCPDEEEKRRRSLHLLDLLKRAKELSAQKLSPQAKGKGVGQPRGVLGCKTPGFETFVLETRSYLRAQLNFCERASQRVLMYSNNFLHRQLKSAPDQSARIQRVGGGQQNLKPISDLPKQSCCQDRCVLMALTHSRLLEEWRTAARRGQRDARRVLAEMLTPSGGSKANCHRFIRMVTGCAHTTICLVSEQMRRTQGSREPPEHGLRRFWRQQRGENQHAGEMADSEVALSANTAAEMGGEEEEENEDEGSTGEGEDLGEVRIPTPKELAALGTVEASRRLRQQRQKLAKLQRQLAQQKRELANLRKSRPPLMLGCCSEAIEPAPVLQRQPQPPLPPPVQTPQVLHILEVPSSPTSVIPSVVESPTKQLQPQHQLQLQATPQPTISVLTASGEFEPVSVSMLPGQALSNVFFLPDYDTVATTLQETDPNVFSSSCGPEAKSLQVQVNNHSQLQSTVHLQLPADLPLQVASDSQVLCAQSQQLLLPAAQRLAIPVMQTSSTAVPVQQTTQYVTVSELFLNKITQLPE